ncbi:MAG: endonuclease/exonuclease/phosphatase family protein [Acidobacteria bacterium]|nr:endonuclease/exonuclease/phosphatase family protein [Acidobacteriota bacterium]
MNTVLLLLIALPCLGQSLRVMSYNVRYPNKDDGADLWERRRDLFIESIRSANPDLIGTQELFKLQGDYLVEKLPQYAWFGTSRRGNHEDEHMGVFYRKAALRLVEQGQFWLSETPEVAGSESWGMSLPRMVTWGLFEKGGEQFYLLNTHFAHRRQDEEARLKAAAVIAAKMKGLRQNIAIVVTGDFNAPAGGAVHQAMLASGLRDSRAITSRKLGPEGTFHGFKGKAGEARIDWILVGPQWKVALNETITFGQDGRFPSDHFPVVAEIEQ